jgi:type I restriction enzyme R subunit
MMGLIDDTGDGQRRFGVGHFDLVIIDEAHRSVYQKYKAIFDYFDSFLVGLTATPKDEIDRNTYRLFDLETGVPTDNYGLDEAVRDGFLVPPKAVSVPLKFQREGIKYDDLSDDEKDQWDALEWTEEGEAPDYVDPEALNRWLFNEDTVDKVLEHLMTRGQKVAGGDRLGKTIIFAKNNDHAEFIAKRFNANYPHHKGEFARVITYRTEYAQTLIDNFCKPSALPQIALSVDMLDTGIDIPEIVNLVFFKLVRSKTKFWQMVGRGTRLRPDLFGPGQDKAFFYIFDYCQNLEFFSQNPPVVEGAVGESLTTRLFKGRLQLVSALDARASAPASVTIGGASVAHEALLSAEEQTVRDETAALLHSQVAAMNPNNFIVRPHRRVVERYAEKSVWQKLDPEQVNEVATVLAHLPTEVVDTDEEAKRFDLLMLRLQLALLTAQPGFERWKEQVRAVAALLLEQGSIPAVREQMALIESVAGEEWWEDVTVPMLEVARRRLRALVKLIEKAKRKPVYSDFEDELGLETTIDLPHLQPGTNLERFRAKVRQFLSAHENHITIHKVRFNQPLTSSDLDELERMMLEAGVGTAQDFATARNRATGSACSSGPSSGWTDRLRRRLLVGSCQPPPPRPIKSSSSIL